MGLDLSKLQNVKAVAGKTTARCPACAASGGDAKGDHLIIYPDDGYGCVANPKDKAHTKEIFRLAGVAGGQGSNSKITVRAVDVPASSVLMDLKGFDRFKVTPIPRPQKPAPAETPEPAAEKPPADDVPPPSATADVGGPPPLDGDCTAENVKPPPRTDWVDLDGKPTGGVPAKRSFTGDAVWEFLGVTKEAFHSTEVKPEEVC